MKLIDLVRRWDERDRRYADRRVDLSDASLAAAYSWRRSEIDDLTDPDSRIEALSILNKLIGADRVHWHK